MKQLNTIVLCLLFQQFSYAEIEVDIYPTPDELYGLGHTATWHNFDLDDDGQPDLNIWLEYDDSVGFFSEARTYPGKGVEFYAVTNDLIIANDCGANLHSNGHWVDSGTLARYGSESQFEDEGDKYIGFRMIDSSKPLGGSYYTYGWVKLRVSGNRRTIDIYGYGFNDVSIHNSIEPNIVAGEGSCNVSVQNHELPVEAISIIGNTVRVASTESITASLFDLSGKMVYSEAKPSGNAVFELPSFHSIMILNIQVGNRSRALKVLPFGQF